MIDLGAIIHETYRIDRQIGRGSMGVVFEAAHLRLPRRFAIKVLHAGVGDHQALERFRREAEICSRLGHDNIVEVIDFNRLGDGQPYIVMELLEGESLRARLLRQRTLPLADVVRLARAIGNGLAAVHALGIVHRDLKPENVFLSHNASGEAVKVLDFGISKVAGSISLSTHSDALLGTPGYMAPEQARGDGSPVDARADQFALGAILYEALTGRAAFFVDGEPPYTVLYKIVHRAPLPLYEQPAPVAEVIMRVLAKDAAARFADVTAFVAALEAAALAPAAAPRPRRPARRALVAGTLLAAAGAATFGLVRATRHASAPAATPATSATTTPTVTATPAAATPAGPPIDLAAADAAAPPAPASAASPVTPPPARPATATSAARPSPASHAAAGPKGHHHGATAPSAAPRDDLEDPYAPRAPRSR